MYAETLALSGAVHSRLNLFPPFFAISAGRTENLVAGVIDPGHATIEGQPFFLSFFRSSQTAKHTAVQS